MRFRFPPMLLALSLPVLCWTLAGCGGGYDAADTSTQVADNAASPSTNTSDEPPATPEEPLPEVSSEEPGDTALTDDPMVKSVDAAPVDVAPVDAAPVDDVPAEDVPTDAAPVDAAPTDAAPVEDVPVEDVPADAAPGGGVAPNQGTAAKSDLPDVPEDSAAWPAVELIRRVRAGQTDSIPELLYPSQQRGLVGKLASESLREEAVTELKGLFSEIIPISERQIDGRHDFTVVNSKESRQIDFTVRRTKDGFRVYNVSSREVSERDLQTMLQGRRGGAAGRAGGAGNTGGF